MYIKGPKLEDVPKMINSDIKIITVIIGIIHQSLAFQRKEINSANIPILFLKDFINFMIFVV